MNSEGSFTAIVAAALVFLIASIGFTYYSTGVSQKALLEQQDALELRQHWSNLRYLLYKAAAEALYDASDSSCSVTPQNYALKVSDYFGRVLDDSKTVFSCEFSNSPSTISNGQEFSFTLKCSKSDLLSYSALVKLKKDLRSDGAPSPSCQVFDVQSVPEFQEIPSV